MAHVTQGDIEELWNSAPHNWSGLQKNLQSRQGKAEGISNNVVEDMLRITQDMERSGQSFPGSPQQLYDMMNRRLRGDVH